MSFRATSRNLMQYHIFSPYRVCPLGAHVDHQRGIVTGFAIDKGVDLWFDVREDSSVILDSETFSGHVEFDIARSIQESIIPHDYPAFPERNDFDIFQRKFPESFLMPMLPCQVFM